MRKLGLLTGLVILAATGGVLAQTAMRPAAPANPPPAPPKHISASDQIPYWAYPVPTRKWPEPDPQEVLRLPGTKVVKTVAQTNDRFKIADWRPNEHPRMPPIVEFGRKPDVMACGYCHLPNGHGRPENASLAGQPAEYIKQQVIEMREGRRKSSETRMGSINAMMRVAQHTTDEEARIAGEYFSKVKYNKWIRVIETDVVPKTEIASRNMLMRHGKGSEPIGQRILEVPENLYRTEARDPASGFIAYVPKGSVARGKKLVESGAGGFPCAACHGADMKGLGNAPALAGRSPSGIVRQLYDFRSGTRGGPAAEMMKVQVANMTPAMRLDVAAYLASLNP